MFLLVRDANEREGNEMNVGSATGYECENCWTRQGKWYVIDDNYETTLCGPCVKDLRSYGEDVKRIES
jgi:uncharacterized membrane protein